MAVAYIKLQIKGGRQICWREKIMSTVKPETYPSSPLPKANIRRILCASTLTGESSEALDYAILLARSYNAKLFCFYAVETDQEGYQAKYPEIENRFTKVMASYLNPVDEPILDWEIIVNQGEAANQIVETSILNEIDLIVMLSRRRPLGAALIGSTAELVCKTAPCSVLVIHPKETSWTNKETGKVELSRILVGCDFSDFSKFAFSYALEFAYTFSSEIDLIEILPKGVTDNGSPVFGNATYRSLNKLQQLIPETAISYKINRFVAEGEPYKEILAHAKERSIDLICIGAHGKDSSLEYLLGTTTDEILRASPCPILVTRF
jgi:nucleotide-binding universal stress UspA family protein